LPFSSPEHSTVSNLRLISAGLQALDYPPLKEPYTPECYPLQFSPTAEEQRWVQDRLKKAGIDAEATVIVIHPGTGAAVKLWRPEAWANCANTLTTASLFPTPVHIILTGSRQERPMLEEIAQQITTPPLLITDATVG